MVATGVFYELLESNGYLLSNIPYTLEKDQVLFQKGLRHDLRTHPIHAFPSIIDVFMAGLDRHLSRAEYFHSALQFSQYGGREQDSLVRLLLNIEDLQSGLVTLLVEKLLVLAYEQGEDVVETCRLILANLQRLEKVPDPQLLCDKMLELLDSAPLQIQREIIACLPDIVSDSSHEKVADNLCRLYFSTPSLSLHIVEALCSVSLSEQCVAAVKLAVQKGISSTKLAHCATAVKFLLEDAGRADELIDHLRAHISLLQDSHNISEKESQIDSSLINHQMAVLNNIKLAMHIERRQTAAWIKSVERVCESRDHRSLDLLILLLISENFSERRRCVDTLLKKHVRVGVFTCHVLRQTFASFAPLLSQFGSALRRLAALLIRAGNSTIVDYAVEMYRLMLSHWRGADTHRTLVCLMNHNCDSASVRSRVLQLLQQLAEQQRSSLSPYITIIKSWLDILDRLTLSECGQLMELLITLSLLPASVSVTDNTTQSSCSQHGDNNDSVLGELDADMRMLINKQLTSNCDRYRRIGVMSVVSVIKRRHEGDITTSSSSVSASAQNQSEGVSESSLSVSQRDTVQLLCDAAACVQSAPTAAGLLLDQLAAAVWTAELSAAVERWLCDHMMDSFQETFVLDLPWLDTECGGLSVALKFGLEEENRGDIALNICPLLMSSTRGAGKVATLCAHFRLVRMCVTSLHDGCMQSLDALLGCPLVLPDDAAIGNFALLSEQHKHAALTSLFVAVNFFRELLNAFATQKDCEIKKRCVQRLRDILTLRRQIDECLSHCVTFEPPCALFHLDPPAMLSLSGVTGSTLAVGNSLKRKLNCGPPRTVRKAGVKKRKPLVNDEDETAETTACASLSANVSSSCQPSASSAGERASQAAASVSAGSLRLFFREFDMDVFKLLYRRFSLTENIAETFCVRPSELLYLLDDLSTKLAHCVRHHSSSSSLSPGFITNSAAAAADTASHACLDMLEVLVVARQAVAFIKPLSLVTDGIVHLLKSQMTPEEDAVSQASTQTYKHTPDECLCLHECLCVVYRVISTIITWSLVQQHPTLLKDAVANIRTTQDCSQQLVSQMPVSQQQQPVKTVAPTAAAARVFQLLRAHATVLRSVESAAHLAKILAALAPSAQEEAVSQELERVCEGMLQTEWMNVAGGRDSGAAYNTHIGAVLRVYLRGALSEHTDNNEEQQQGQDWSRKSRCLLRLTDQALEELLNSPARHLCSQSFPTFNKGTFVVYYRCMFAATASLVRHLSQSQSQSSGDKLNQLSSWTSAVSSFSRLVNAVRVFSSRAVVSVCLKHSRLVVERFVHAAVPLMSSLLKSHKQPVLATLKNFQLSARYLHHVCNHCKSSKDSLLLRYVPLLKKVLETFVFRIKAMLALHSCHDAFWLGNLKNRDLHGDEIPSQPSGEGDNGGEDGDDTTDSDNSDSVSQHEHADKHSDCDDNDGSNDDNLHDDDDDGTRVKHDSEVSEAY